MERDEKRMVFDRYLKEHEWNVYEKQLSFTVMEGDDEHGQPVQHRHTIAEDIATWFSTGMRPRYDENLAPVGKFIFM